jgi:osmotically-inducible protein OsmY
MILNAHEDRDLERRIRHFLTDKNYAALGGVDIRAQKGMVTLRGRVTSFYEKQLAISCARRVAGVIGLNDELEVD